MNTFPTSTLIISTYNWPEALRLCLLSVKEQSVLPDEVIVADDGSTKSTEDVIESIRPNFPTNLVHIWHEDHGFQLSKIRNKAIAKSSNEYIIQIDGDLVLCKHFIKDHLNLSKRGTFVSGSRVLMNQPLSQKVLQSQNVRISPFESGLINAHNRIRVTWLSRYMADRYKTGSIFSLRGCNMAFWRADLLKVNGYNEGFQHWGGEDSEIAARLMNSGIKKRAVKFGGVAYHMYHEEVARTGNEKTEEYIMNALQQRITFCKNGIEQHVN